jgi:hypothetical protein
VMPRCFLRVEILFPNAMDGEIVLASILLNLALSLQ